MTSAVEPKPMSRTKAILYGLGLPLALVALVFVPAGRIGWPPGWIFIAVLVAIFGVSALLLARVNPMIYRARSRFQPGTKKWDLVLLAALFPAIIAEIPIATLDAGRMGSSAVPQPPPLTRTLSLNALDRICGCAYLRLCKPR